MTGEGEVLIAVVARLDALRTAYDEDLALLGVVPTDLAAFNALPPARRVASRALLKTVEQLQDQLARLFRLLPRLLLVDTVGWHAQDFANHAEKLGVLEDAFGWTDIVRLRNRMVHDYPLSADAQFETLRAAAAVAPTLIAAALAARAFADRQDFSR